VPEGNYFLACYQFLNLGEALLPLGNNPGVRGCGLASWPGPMHCALSPGSGPEWIETGGNNQHKDQLQSEGF